MLVLRIKVRFFAMACSMNDFHLHFEIVTFIGANQLMRLIDGNLNILIAMENKKRWIIGVNLKNRTRFSGHVWNIFHGLT